MCCLCLKIFKEIFKLQILFNFGSLTLLKCTEWSFVSGPVDHLELTFVMWCGVFDVRLLSFTYLFRICQRFRIIFTYHIIFNF